MSSRVDRWGVIAWQYQSKADAVYDLLGQTLASDGGVVFPDTVTIAGDATDTIVLNTVATNLLTVTADGQGGVSIDGTLNTAAADAFEGYITVDINGTPGYIPIWSAPPTTT